MAEEAQKYKRNEWGGINKPEHLLFFINRLELDSIVGIFAAASRATSVKIFFNMVPTKTAKLQRVRERIRRRRQKCLYAKGTDLVTTRARLKIQI